MSDDPTGDRPDDIDVAGETHRGAFGEFGGESGAFIDRAFREKIVLVGVAIGGVAEEKVDTSLDELSRLVDTAGADEVGRVVQRRTAPDPSTFVGKGKVEEIKGVAVANDCDTVVFDDELSPAQQYNLERRLGRTAIDRAAVILDIFAQNASSQEGKAQVELAQLRYRLPRIRGKGRSLSQQAGHIGTRGPGETQLEVDRRRLLRRVHKLEGELRDIARNRDTQRKSRRRSGLRHVVIVGYTNAGKSTVLNCLTDAGVLVEDRLFATLDATTRRLDLPGGETVLCTDTVGFVRKLPHQLVEAFKSTLVVTTEADLLVHVVDSSADDPEAQIQAVHEVLEEIGGLDAPELIVANKADVAPEAARRLLAHHPGAVAISATTGAGIDGLVAAISDRLRSLVDPVVLHIPYTRGDLIAALHRSGLVLSETATEDTLVMRAQVERADLGRFVDYVVDGTVSGFVPPPYPYDRLRDLESVAAAQPGGAVDLSIGTPSDPPPRAVLDAMAASDSERGYPPSIGTADYRAAASAWMARRLGVEVDSERALAGCVGTKELVVGLPHLLHLRDPQRDTVLYPAVSYPSYAMGATLAGCRAVPVAVDECWRLDLSTIDPEDARRALCLWVNSPGNPAGGLDDLQSAAEWGRERGVIVASDECYVEFTWVGPSFGSNGLPGDTILRGGLDGVLAVHSLSKRSNLAGARAGFYAGDPALVDYLREVRKHQGLMIPGPVQAGAVAAWSDDEHVVAQRDRYLGRMRRLAAGLGAAGVEVSLPEGGFYLWVAAPEGDAWAFARRLAEVAGVVSSPGEFYGEAAPGYVRLALVQPDDRIELALDRVASAGTLV